jgi:hypothetical protein
MKIEIEVPDNLGRQFLAMNYQQKVAFNTVCVLLSQKFNPQNDISAQLSSWLLQIRWENLPNTLDFSEKEKAVFANLFYLWLSPPQDDILTIMNRLSEKAAANGMTAEILDQLLDEE